MKIKYKNTKLQNIMEVASLLIIISMFLLVIIRWDSLPDKIPGHYNALGEVNRWGNKGELIILPIVSIMMYLLLTVVTAFPSIWNMPVTVTEENRVRVIGCTKNMMLLMKAEMLLMFAYINYNTMEVKALSPLFLPVTLVIIFGTLIFFIVRTIKLSKDRTTSNKGSY